MRIYVTDAEDTMNIDIDEDGDGVFEYHYESSGILAEFGGTLGAGLGIGGWATQSDNWALGDGPSGPTLAVSGSFTIAGGTCAGTTLDIGAPTLAGIFGADASGTLSLTVTLPAGVCGLTVQAVDTSTCSASNSAVL